MAYKKTVQGRTYPHLYNVTMTVGARRSVAQKPQFQTKTVGSGAMGVPMVSAKMTTVQTSSSEPNKRDDVMLVQYLLKRVYQRGQNCQPQLSQSSGAAQLKIDGLYGPATARAVEQFQMEMRRNGHNIATDGCVDPELGESATSSISKTGYTISWLNKYFWVLYPYLAPDISTDPECPAELKKVLCDGSV